MLPSRRKHVSPIEVVAALLLVAGSLLVLRALVVADAGPELEVVAEAPPEHKAA
jgi:hypothetical protein